MAGTVDSIISSGAALTGLGDITQLGMNLLAPGVGGLIGSVLGTTTNGQNDPVAMAQKMADIQKNTQLDFMNQGAWNKVGQMGQAASLGARQSQDLAGSLSGQDQSSIAGILGSNNAMQGQIQQMGNLAVQKSGQEKNDLFNTLKGMSGNVPLAGMGALAKQVDTSNSGLYGAMLQGGMQGQQANMQANQSASDIYGRGSQNFQKLMIDPYQVTRPQDNFGQSINTGAQIGSQTRQDTYNYGKAAMPMGTAARLGAEGSMEDYLRRYQEQEQRKVGNPYTGPMARPQNQGYDAYGNPLSN